MSLVHLAADVSSQESARTLYQRGKYSRWFYPRVLLGGRLGVLGAPPHL